MATFDPASTMKSVHETLDQAYAALPPTANHAVILDGTVQGKDKAISAYFVQRAPKGWEIVLGGEWKGGDDLAGKVAIAKAW